MKHIIGEGFDIPSPDVNTNRQIMMRMVEEYVNSRKSKVKSRKNLSLLRATFRGNRLGRVDHWGGQRILGVGV